MQHVDEHNGRIESLAAVYTENGILRETSLLIAYTIFIAAIIKKEESVASAMDQD